MERTSAAQNRRNATARCNAATRASVPWRPRGRAGSPAPIPGVLPIAAAPTRNASGHRGRRTACSTVVFGPWSATGCRTGSVVVLVNDRRPPGATSSCSATITPVAGSTRTIAPVVDDDGHRGADQPGRYRVASRPYRMQDQAVDLAQHRRRPICNAATAVCSSSCSAINRSSGIAWISGMERGVDLGAPGHGGSVGGPQIHGFAGDRGLGQQRHRQIALGVAAQVLHDALRLRVTGVTEVGANP